MATGRRPTKAEQRRSRALAAKAAIARAERRARTVRIGLWAGAAVVVIALVVTAVVVLNRPKSTDTTTTGAASPSAAATPSAAGSGRATNPPWDAPADASAAAAAAGLEMLGAEGTAVHIHTHLDVFANGAAVTVPADIGIDVARKKISALHSHDTTGVIHVESPTSPASFTLGQYFTEWQVSLSADHIGGLKVDDTHHLKVYVNGAPRDGNPAGIVLAAHDEIAIVYGTDAQQPTVPKSYEWTNGL